MAALNKETRKNFTERKWNGLQWNEKKTKIFFFLGKFYDLILFSKFSEEIILSIFENSIF